MEKDKLIGKYFYIKNHKSRTVLTLQNKGNEEYNETVFPVVCDKLIGSDNQKWKLLPTSQQDCYHISCKYKGLIIDLPHGLMLNNVKIITNIFKEGHSRQIWQFEKSEQYPGYYQIENTLSKTAIDLGSGLNNENGVVQGYWKKKNNVNQTWKLQNVDDTFYKFPYSHYFFLENVHTGNRLCLMNGFNKVNNYVHTEKWNEQKFEKKGFQFLKRYKFLWKTSITHKPGFYYLENKCARGFALEIKSRKNGSKVGINFKKFKDSQQCWKFIENGKSNTFLLFNKKTKTYITENEDENICSWKELKGDERDKMLWRKIYFDNPKKLDNKEKKKTINEEEIPTPTTPQFSVVDVLSTMESKKVK